MNVLRCFPRPARALLALCLLLSPLLAIGKTVGAPALAGLAHMHMHGAMPVDRDSRGADHGCTQNDSCSAQCCTACAHCTGALTDLSPLSPVLPAIYVSGSLSLLSTPFIDRRERPPRPGIS